MNVLKIALICTEKLPVPAILGGAIQTYIDGILPYLAQYHHITVFSTAFQGLPSYERKGNVRYVRISHTCTRDYIHSVNSRLDKSFDLVYIFNRPLWVLSICESHPKLNYSLSLHNEMFHPDRITKSEALECIDRLEFITAVSRYIANMVSDFVPQAKEKISVVYSGAEEQPFCRPDSEGYRLEKKRLKESIGLGDKKIVLFVGRLIPDKGIHVLIEAMKQVMEERNDAALVVVGSSSWSIASDAYVKSIVRLSGKLSENALFTGFLPPSEITAYYHMADLFVCPSQWAEPLARVLYEAMAAGLPVITTNRGGNPEVVRNDINGIVVDDYKSAQCLAKAICFLLDNASIALEMGKTGHSQVADIYNWRRVAKDIQNLIISSHL
ncbi:MAG: glycosyltransferase family 4 protein [Clostridiaceae bacterium]